MVHIAPLGAILVSKLQKELKKGGERHKLRGHVGYVHNTLGYVSLKHLKLTTGVLRILVMKRSFLKFS